MSNFNEAEKLFYDNANYNASLASAHSKAKYKGITWGGKQVTPTEVLEKLKGLGLEITQRTLQRYEKAELIPVPKRGSAGRGKGKFTDYPPETVWEAYVAHYFMHDELFEWSSNRIAKARKNALDGIKIKKDGGIANLDINGYEFYLWRLYSLYLKYGLNIHEADPVGGLGSLFRAIQDEDKEGIRKACLSHACQVSEFCFGYSVWHDHVQAKFNLPDGWNNEDDSPEYVLNEPCPNEEQCLKKLKHTWLKDCCIYNDEENNNVKFCVYEREPGSDSWVFVAEEKF